MQKKYTSKHAPRGTRPDAVAGDRLKVFKEVSRLHATYQIRLLTFLALEYGMKLEIHVPKCCHVEPDLKALLAQYPRALLVVER